MEKIPLEQLTNFRLHCFEGIGTCELQGLQMNFVKLAGVNDKTRDKIREADRLARVEERSLVL